MVDTLTSVLSNSPFLSAQVVGILKGANFNTTADQPIVLNLPTGLWRFNSLTVTNPSTSLTTAVGGLYSAPAKGGNIIVAATQVYTALTASGANTAGAIAFIAGTTFGNTAMENYTTVYFSLTTPQGAAATADLYVVVTPIF